MLSINKFIVAAVLLTGFSALSLPVQAQGNTAYKLPPAKAYQTFEQLRASPGPRQAYGYYFAVSPDERWIASLSDSTRDGNVLTVVHAPSGAKWQHTFTPQTGSVVRNWFPNCFSPDSGSIVYGSLVAKLAEKMPVLSFDPFKPDTSELKRGTFLGFNGRLKNAAGEEVKFWSGLSQSEGEEGNIAWSLDGRTLYESAIGEEQKFSSLKRTPSGKIDQIDYSRLVSLHEFEQKKPIAQAREEVLKDKSLSAEMRQLREREFVQTEKMFAGSKKIRLGNLTVSPNGQYLAGIASIAAEEMGFGGQKYGVIILLAGDRLQAYPFDTPVYGQMIWSRDSQSLYFYSQSELVGGGGDGGGNGTVRKLQLNGIAIGKKK